MSDRDFLCPHARYRGGIEPENLVFNPNLHEFSQGVSYICNLETAGKITSEQAYQNMSTL
jgi:hypothetical protein